MPIFFEKFGYENLKKTEISDIIYSESEKRKMLIMLGLMLYLVFVIIDQLAHILEEIKNGKDTY